MAHGRSAMRTSPRIIHRGHMSDHLTHLLPCESITNHDRFTTGSRGVHCKETRKPDFVGERGITDQGDQLMDVVDSESDGLTEWALQSM